jgi:galactofuranosylgalactofuranosylrhamnosyl-N-acetylglucosaminyl-diphospho-decaprenol beta-1,5/1,6-galactofuranosyltransferase
MPTPDGPPATESPRPCDAAIDVLQRTLFSAAHMGASDDLYAVVTRGTAHRERHRLLMSPYAEVTTETYFGRFPAAYYQRWTDVACVQVDVTVVGEATASVRASDAEGSARTVVVETAAGDGPHTLRLSASVDRFLDGGSLWVEISAGPQEVAVLGVEWRATTPPRQRRTSVVICTFNRESECVETLNRLAADGTVMSLVESVMVVDQGTKPVAEHQGYSAVASALGNRLRYLQQPNLGGAGGFTRGMYEASAGSGTDHAHVLLMDDDISLEPETVLRVTAFANRTTQPAIVGSQMLYLFHPERLHVGAETADLGTLSRGLAVPGALEEIDVTKVLPHARVDAGYNAWFSCLIPAEALAITGLPLPCFIQWDDVEFGLRAAERGVPTVTLPGAAVWHADFTWKDGDEWSSYFHFRNALIAAAVHGKLRGTRVAAQLGRSLAGMLAGLQYGQAATLIKAIDDFLSGPSVLSDGGVAAVAEARALRDDHIESVRRTPAEVDQHLGHRVTYGGDARPSRHSAVTLPVRLARQLFGATGSETAALRASQAVWQQASPYRTVVVTDSGRDALRIRSYDREQSRRLARAGSLTLAKLVRRTTAVQHEWQVALGDLTARDNWRRLFEL